MIRRVLPLVLFLGALSGVREAQTGQFGQYWPTGLGYSWKYTNSTNPLDIYFWDVVQAFPFGGYPGAVKLGLDANNALVVANDGTTFSILAAYEGGVLNDTPDVHIGTFGDSYMFDYDPSDNVFTVIRFWQNLDHSLTGAYGVNQSLTDVVLLVWYDTTFPANSQNAIVESNGTAYGGGVTDIDFLQLGCGPIHLVGVDAASGNLEPRYDVSKHFDCNANQSPDHIDIETGGSLDANGNCVPDECELAAVPLLPPPALAALAAVIALAGGILLRRPAQRGIGVPSA
jgi:hypothetical protein